MIVHRFTCSERKIWSNIKKSQNVIKMIVVKQKAFYLYGCMSDFEKFKEQFSSKEKFYMSSTVLNVRNKFDMKTVKNYHKLYLKCDVLLLADVFEKIRGNSVRNYGFCASHYLDAPDLIWDAML